MKPHERRQPPLRNESSAPGAARRRWLLTAATMLLGVALSELLALVFMRAWVVSHYPSLLAIDFQDYVAAIDDRHVKHFRQGAYDPELGWDVGPNSQHSGTNTAGEPWTWSTDELGSRVSPHPGSVALISVYGDSYAFGHELQDHQTWPAVVSMRTGTRVLNFGVGAYGTDQAFLKLQRNWRRGTRTPIVILSVWVDSIPRLLGIYRPFYRPQTGMRLGFKPMVKKASSGYVWLGNPLPRLLNREDVRAALDRAKVDDYWYQVRSVPMGFPHLLGVSRLAWLALSGRQNPQRDLWGGGEATERLAFLVHSFVQHARDHGYRPVLLVIPGMTDLRLRQNGDASRYGWFVERLRHELSETEMVLVDLLEVPFDESRFHVTERGHTSAYGCEVIASALMESIESLHDELGHETP